MEKVDCETLVSQITNENYTDAQISLEAVLRDKCASHIQTVLQQNANEH